MPHQIEMISLEELVPRSHQYRKFIEVFDFAKVKHHLRSVEKDANYKGYGVDSLFRCLLLQFMEDVSDRELERIIQENTSAKWFCGFTLSEATPDFSVFSRARSRIGTNKLSKIFTLLRDQMRRKGFMSEVFSKQRRRVRYCGIAKNQFAEFMNVICLNMKRMIVLEKHLATDS